MPQASNGTPVKGGVLNIAVAPEPTLLTSAFITTMNIGTLSSKILEGLVSYDLDLKPVPALATSWERSTDGKTLSFQLRPGVKWHDGAEFTSADVEYTMQEVWRKLHPFGRAAPRSRMSRRSRRRTSSRSCCGSRRPRRTS
jgi:peptide/nickel transport system substrate-binding protein